MLALFHEQFLRLFQKISYKFLKLGYSFQKISNSPSDRPILIYDEITEPFFVWFSKSPGWLREGLEGDGEGRGDSDGFKMG